jgi:hypothetical protein
MTKCAVVPSTSMQVRFAVIARFSNLYGSEGVPTPVAPKRAKSELLLMTICSAVWYCATLLVPIGVMLK